MMNSHAPAPDVPLSAPSAVWRGAEPCRAGYHRAARLGDPGRTPRAFRVECCARRSTPSRCCRWAGPNQEHHRRLQRHGTTTLFATLDGADGKVPAQCNPRHRHQVDTSALACGYERTPASSTIITAVGATDFAISCGTQLDAEIANVLGAKERVCEFGHESGGQRITRYCDQSKRQQQSRKA